MIGLNGVSVPDRELATVYCCQLLYADLLRSKVTIHFFPFNFYCSGLTDDEALPTQIRCDGQRQREEEQQASVNVLLANLYCMTNGKKSDDTSCTLRIQCEC